MVAFADDAQVLDLEVSFGQFLHRCIRLWMIGEDGDHAVELCHLNLFRNRPARAVSRISSIASRPAPAWLMGRVDATLVGNAGPPKGPETTQPKSGLGPRPRAETARRDAGCWPLARISPRSALA